MNQKKNVKPKRIKIWPEIESYGPIMFYIQPFQKAEKILVEFTNCKEVDSCGLNILLMRLAMLGFISDVTAKEADLAWPTSDVVNTMMNETGFFYYLNKWFYFDRKYAGSLLECFYDFRQPHLETPVTIRTKTGLSQHSYPIYMFDFLGQDRRSGWSKFQGWLLNILNRYSNYRVPRFELLNIVKEMFKNSADHTNGNASFGLDIRENAEGSCISISFTFLDLGKGIYKNIQDVLENKYNGRTAHGSLTEVYYKAMQKGFSTKALQNNLNMGLGMDVITRGSKSIGLNLSVFDAQSRGLLTSIKEVTHAEIRRHFYDVKSQVVFCYYGHICCEARS